MAERGLAVDPARHIVGDDDDLGLEVAAPGLVGERDRIARRQHLVGAALVHQRIGPEAFGQRRAARLPDEGDMVHIGRSVRPLIGAGQRRGGLALVEPLERDRLVRDIGGEQPQLRLDPRPIVQRGLKSRGDVARVGTPGEIVTDDDEPAVTAGFQGGELH